ncbi:MAG: nitrite/sulfite reductase [Deferrisomatales bacterium]
MVPSGPELRIRGVYPQAQEGRYMLRVKVPGGSLSATQAAAVAALSEELAGTSVHLTTRMSVELHGLSAEGLAPAWEGLGRVGLTSRGACGGAVRGVAVSTPRAPAGPAAQGLARTIHAHVTGAPRFEGLPKKFKVGVDGEAGGGRHRIQDMGLVASDREGTRFDVWVAGGLGRAPRPAFLFEHGVAADRIVPLLEAVVTVYRERAPRGKRLKHVAEEHGEEALGRWIRERWDPGARVPPEPGTAPGAPRDPGAWVDVPVFAGQLAADTLRQLAAWSRTFGDGSLVLTPDQDLALAARSPREAEAARRALAEIVPEAAAGGRIRCRVCPGSHECRLGLAPTREVAAAVLQAAGERAGRYSWAVSGCANSCAQPQLADVGVLCTRLVRGEGGRKTPLYDLLFRKGEGFGAAVLRRVPLEEVLAACRERL